MVLFLYKDDVNLRKFLIQKQKNKEDVNFKSKSVYDMNKIIEIKDQ